MCTTINILCITLSFQLKFMLSRTSLQYIVDYLFPCIIQITKTDYKIENKHIDIYVKILIYTIIYLTSEVI